MEYAKFSKSTFDRLGFDSPEAKSLAEQLQADVMLELHQAVLPVLHAIVAHLNTQGHCLTLYDEGPGEVAYRDISGPEECKLRLACDIVVSAGYGHLLSADQLRDL